MGELSVAAEVVVDVEPMEVYAKSWERWVY